MRIGLDRKYLVFGSAPGHLQPQPLAWRNYREVDIEGLRNDIKIDKAILVTEGRFSGVVKTGYFKCRAFLARSEGGKIAGCRFSLYAGQNPESVGLFDLPDFLFDVVYFKYRGLDLRLRDKSSRFLAPLDKTGTREFGENLVHRHPRHVIGLGELDLEREAEAWRPVS